MSYALAAAVFFLPFSKSAAEIFAALALVLWIPAKMTGLFKRGQRPFLFEKWRCPLFLTTVCYAAFMGFLLFSMQQVPPEHLFTGLRGLVKWLQYLLLFWMARDLAADPGRARLLVAAFLVSAVLLAANGFYQVLAGVDLVKHYSVDIPGRLVRMKSSMPSPNDLATFLMLAIPVSFFLWLERKRWDLKSGALAATLALFSLAFIMTLSRSAFFSLAAACLLYALCRRKRSVLLGMLLVTAIFLGSGVLRENFLASLSWDDITIVERLRFWKVSWAMIREHPFLGHGVNMYTREFSRFAPPDEAYRGYAHNCYLQMWAEIGLFGLLAFLAPLGLAFRNFVKQGKNAGPSALPEAIFVWIMAFSVQAFFDTQFYAMQTAILFWVFWGVFHKRVPH